MSYKFNLREDMPRGFKQNDQYPELPLILEYLKTYDDRIFLTVEEFQRELDGFLPFLDKSKIPKSADPKLREGLVVVELEERFIRDAGGWNYFVFTPASNTSGKCVFGGLELVTSA